MIVRVNASQRQRCLSQSPCESSMIFMLDEERSVQISVLCRAREILIYKDPWKGWQFHLHNCFAFVPPRKSPVCGPHRSCIIAFFQLFCSFLSCGFSISYTDIYMLLLCPARTFAYLSVAASWLVSVTSLFSSSASCSFMEMKHVRLLICVL